MSAVIEWLESPEGEKWSRWRHSTNSDNAVFRCILINVIDDDGNKITQYPLWVAG